MLVGACTKPSQDEYPGMDKVQYKQTDEFIANPERGFYTGYSCESSDEAPLSKYALQLARSEKRTLMMAEFWLKEFFTSDISEEYLQIVRKTLQAFRDGGCKCILRFGYSNIIHDLNNPDADRPFDASEEQVLRHIAQLKPILEEYADVIYVLQAGFIGCWGEWHYTDNFIQSPQNTEDYLPRKRVTEALLDALPSSRQITAAGSGSSPEIESLLHPFTILLTIPLALVGAVLMFLITGITVNIMGIIGMVMLAGIAVNNSIILVDRIGQLKDSGLSLTDAIAEAGQQRIRPILMTSLTTILALVPMALGIGEGASLSSPMAIAVIGGLVTSTLLSLVVIPCVYYVFESAKIRITGK